MTAVTAQDLQAVRKGRIVFSHHSVGRNLLAGLQAVNANVGAGELKVLGLDGAKGAPTAPALIEVSGGRNQDPKSKVDFFRALITEQQLRPEVAFMKFCYVDFNPSTDVDAVFAYYRETMDALKKQHPEITFAHVTVPLVVRPMDLKERIYRLIGKEVWEDTANAKRYEFNQRLLKEYAQDPIFDLARAESTRPDGSRETFEYNGRTYFSLTPQYTDDDGHLNAAGQAATAPEMVRFLAKALQSRPGPQG
jgi:hypothetical protein